MTIYHIKKSINTNNKTDEKCDYQFLLEETRCKFLLAQNSGIKRIKIIRNLNREIKGYIKH